MDGAWKALGDQIFKQMVANGNIIATENENEYKIGKEPDLFEENKHLVQFWYCLNEKLGPDGRLLGPKK